MTILSSQIIYMMKYITTKKLVNKSGLNGKIKKLATKEKKNLPTKAE